MLLTDRVILVTGAARGIGRGIAEAIVEEGGAVLVTDRDEVTLEATATRLTRAGGGVIAVRADVTDRDEMKTALARAVSAWGRLDGLVNNAGLLRMGPALEAHDDDWQSQLTINLKALAACSNLAARQMIEQGSGGAIVNVASNAGKVGYPNMAAYNASKAAVISLTRSLAGEWAEHDININAVCPGGVETTMLADVAAWVGEQTGADAGELHATMVPVQLGRHVLPLEVGRVVAFLLSDRATVIRGQSINVDGGDTPY